MRKQDRHRGESVASSVSPSSFLLENLPEEILINGICFILSPRDVLAFGLTSHFFRRLTEDEYLWRHLCATLLFRDYAMHEWECKRDKQLSYKEFFISRSTIDGCLLEGRLKHQSLVSGHLGTPYLCFKDYYRPSRKEDLSLLVRVTVRRPEGLMEYWELDGKSTSSILKTEVKLKGQDRRITPFRLLPLSLDNFGAAEDRCSITDLNIFSAIESKSFIPGLVYGERYLLHFLSSSLSIDEDTKPSRKFKAPHTYLDPVGTTPLRNGRIVVYQTRILVLFSTQTQQPQQQPQQPQQPQPPRVCTVMTGPDTICKAKWDGGRWVVALTKKKVVGVWDLEAASGSEDEVTIFKAAANVQLCKVRGKHLAMCLSSGRLQLIDLEKVRVRGRGCVMFEAFVSSSSGKSNQDSTKLHSCIWMDDKEIFCGSYEGVIKSFSLHNTHNSHNMDDGGAMVYRGGHTSMVSKVKATERVVVSGDWVGSICVWDRVKGALLYRLHPQSTRSYTAMQFHFWLDQGRIVADMGNYVDVFDFAPFLVNRKEEGEGEDNGGDRTCRLNGVIERVVNVHNDVDVKEEVEEIKEEEQSEESDGIGEKRKAEEKKKEKKKYRNYKRLKRAD